MKKISRALILLFGLFSIDSSAWAVSAVEKCKINTEKNRLCTCKIENLHPTQMAVGFIEVNRKAMRIADLQEMTPKKFDKFLKNHPILAVVGPSGVLFPIDHHHLSLALLDAGISEGVCQIVSNLSQMTRRNFWKEMEDRNWVYPYDAKGRGPLDVSKLPTHMRDLADDPYRSLAGIVREAGGFEKSGEGFAEFRWANFFRTRIKIRYDEDNIDQIVIEKAMKLAKSPDASELPGYVSEQIQSEEDYSD